ncbi:MAG: hypothetical protein A2V81_00055 [Candidatus Abawacabacteria bacterium RBG_16_42_10]|uniref:Uncharacterized protein n=1 Tax=Candidatus Abawacabacteria bacterium RBG_16_42_10 TaxID=1817814 RepID=A0A1F4XL90_9BACT|nr:MAG: hypothetical protein A2V81_00055 [Candidatus Abawacabacteria bacterium RBG_16_42_10]
MDSVFSPELLRSVALIAGVVGVAGDEGGVDEGEDGDVEDGDGGIRDSPGTCPRSSGVATKKVKNVSMVFQFITGL